MIKEANNASLVHKRLLPKYKLGYRASLSNFFLNDSFESKFDTFIWNPLQGTRIFKPQKFDIKLSE